MNMVCMCGVLKLRLGEWTGAAPLCSLSAGREISLLVSVSRYTCVCLSGEEERECEDNGAAQAVEVVSRELFHAIQGNTIAGAL